MGHLFPCQPYTCHIKHHDLKSILIRHINLCVFFFQNNELITIFILVFMYIQLLHFRRSYQKPWNEKIWPIRLISDGFWMQSIKSRALKLMNMWIEALICMMSTLECLNVNKSQLVTHGEKCIVDLSQGKGEETLVHLKI